jgi:alpha-L-fucosidase
MFDFRSYLLAIQSSIRWLWLGAFAALQGSSKRPTVPANRSWWQRPGLSVMYQIETRPGWNWDRDYEAFNKSLMDAQGNLQFNGPFCNIEEWVELSKEIGVDYHSFEAKWHDGICYFDTKTTRWKTEKDYAKEFAERSREAGIPFMYYYSAVFDHNPQFDAIQPAPHSTPSLIGNRPEYLTYIEKHYAELVAQYRPDGIWFDWYWAEGATRRTIDYLRKHHPGLVLAFNLSNLFPESFKQIDITSSEAHSYDGAWVKLRKENSLDVPVLTSAKKWSNSFRLTFDHQWELISPAGKWWQDQSLRDDPNELLRTLAMVLACGGKLCIGAGSEMDGHLFPDQITQLRMLGEWYKPRKALFRDAAPIRYRGFTPPGVSVSAPRFDVVVSAYGDGILLHLINRKSAKTGLTITLRGSGFQEFNQAARMPHGTPASAQRSGGALTIELAPADVDPVDTILYLSR